MSVCAEDATQRGEVCSIANHPTCSELRAPTLAQGDRGDSCVTRGSAAPLTRRRSSGPTGAGERSRGKALAQRQRSARSRRRQGNHEPVIVWQVEAVVRAALGSDVCWCANAPTQSTRHAMTDGDTHPPRQPARAPVTQKRSATAWGSMRARLANPAILAAMPLPLATSGRRTSSFSGRAGPRDRAERRVR